MCTLLTHLYCLSSFFDNVSQQGTQNYCYQRMCDKKWQKYLEELLSIVCFTYADMHVFILKDKPKPDLSVSSSWLRPGASVTLHCSVRSHSAEWRFYWYQAFFKNSSKGYYFELLPGGKNGTAQNSYIVHGQKQTAGYACRARRGQPEHFTSYSKPVFVWSAGKCELP